MSRWWTIWFLFSIRRNLPFCCPHRHIAPMLNNIFHQEISFRHVTVRVPSYKMTTGFISTNSKPSRRNLTLDTIKRHSQLIGIGKESSSIYNSQVCGQTERKHKTSGANDHKDISVVKHLETSEPFSNQPERFHRSFPNYALFTGVRSPAKMKECLIYHRELLARQQDLIPRKRKIRQ